MNDELASKEAKFRYWQNHVQEWQNSNLSQSAYCAKSGIKLSTFVYWRSFLNKTDVKKETEFVPVKIIKDKIPDFSFSIQIKLITGHVVHLPAGISLEEVARLINLLGMPHA